MSNIRIDFTDPTWQTEPIVRAMLNALRLLSPHWIRANREPTDSELVALRKLIMSDGAEGIVQRVRTDADFVRHEHQIVRGDATKSCPIDGRHLVAVRLTATGEGWSQSLRFWESRCSDADALNKARGTILTFVHEAEAMPGGAEQIKVLPEIPIGQWPAGRREKTNAVGESSTGASDVGQYTYENLGSRLNLSNDEREISCCHHGIHFTARLGKYSRNNSIPPR